MNNQDLQDEWQNRAHRVIWELGSILRELQDSNPWPDKPYLPRAINQLMTELWDSGFSQTEIRDAFEDAISDMPRYAAGHERR